jgi:hypothetical protein
MPTALPPSSDFTGAAVTEAQYKTAFTALRDFLSGLLGADGLPDTARNALVLPRSVAKNAIIGGDFSTNPWQRGTSFAAPANATYLADRWEYGNTSAAVHTVSQSADAPTVAQAGRLTNHCLLVDCTTADAAVAAGDLVKIAQKVEGYNFIPLAQGAMAFQFWHRHTKTGTYCVSFVNSGVDRSYVAEYTQAVTDTWELATVIIPASPSAGTWNYTNGIGLSAAFALMTGSNYQTAAGAWQTGQFYGTSNQVNACDSTANNFRIALVQLEPGAVATSFESRPENLELALCQRYFWKTFNQGVAPAQGIGSTAGALGYAAVLAGVNTFRFRVPFPVIMRTTPTITTYNQAAMNALWRNATAAADSGTPTVTFTSDHGFLIGNPQVAGDGVNGLMNIHATAEAEL